MTRALVAGSLFVLAAASAAVSARGEEAVSTGEQLFQQRCAACHDERGFGTRVLSRRVPEGQARLEDRRNLTSPYVTAIVRNGIGSMPQIREAELSADELARIAAYLERGPQ